MKKRLAHFVFMVCAITICMTGFAQASDKKPNILVIWGDDIGVWNISHNNRGMMGYTTPNIDRIAKEGLSLGLAEDRRDHRRRDEGHGLCHRSVRQKPPGRPG